MGAETFTHRAVGMNAKDAFRAAVAEAKYDYGHRGYTGTIAEKSEFTMIPLPEGVDPLRYAYQIMSDERVSDKWGPAGCFDLGHGEYLFFGWASA